MNKHRLALALAVAAVALVTAAMAAQEPRQVIVFEVLVPAEAVVVINDRPTTSTGERRLYETPALLVGGEYLYTLGVTHQGKTVSRDLLDAADSADAIVLGPGMGKSPEARDRLKRLIKSDKPMVIDADGLNILAAQKRWPREFAASAVLTPHPGEMKRLARLFDRPNLFADVPSDAPALV